MAYAIGHPSGSDHGSGGHNVLVVQHHGGGRSGRNVSCSFPGRDQGRVCRNRVGRGSFSRPGLEEWGWSGSKSQSVTSPRTINQRLCHAGSGCWHRNRNGPDSRVMPATHCLRPSLTTPTMSAYIGNDTGTLFRVIHVFCTNPDCTNGGSPAPILDGNWGSGGGLATACSGQLTGPVVDGRTGNIFVGCSDGKLYGFTPAGAPIPGSPLIVGTGSGTGGIVDPPMIDAVNGFAYVVSGNSAGGTSSSGPSRHDKL